MAEPTNANRPVQFQCCCMPCNDCSAKVVMVAAAALAITAIVFTFMPDLVPLAASVPTLILSGAVLGYTSYKWLTAVDNQTDAEDHVRFIAQNYDPRREPLENAFDEASARAAADRQEWERFDGLPWDEKLQYILRNIPNGGLYDTAFGMTFENRDKLAEMLIGEWPQPIIRGQIAGKEFIAWPARNGAGPFVLLKTEVGDMLFEPLQREGQLPYLSVSAMTEQDITPYLPIIA